MSEILGNAWEPTARVAESGLTDTPLVAFKARSHHATEHLMTADRADRLADLLRQAAIDARQAKKESDLVHWQGCTRRLEAEGFRVREYSVNDGIAWEILVMNNEFNVTVRGPSQDRARGRVVALFPQARKP